MKPGINANLGKVKVSDNILAGTSAVTQHTAFNNRLYLMKKILLFLLFLGMLALSATAQKGRIRGGYVVRPHVIVGVGGGLGYSPFYGPYYPYPPSVYRYHMMPSRLSLNIQDIQLDYADLIRSVRMDKSISRKERKQRIKELKYEREKAIIDAKRDYYYQRRNDIPPSR